MYIETLASGVILPTEPGNIIFTIKGGTNIQANDKWEIRVNRNGDYVCQAKPGVFARFKRFMAGL